MPIFSGTIFPFAVKPRKKISETAGGVNILEKIKLSGFFIANSLFGFTV